MIEVTVTYPAGQGHTFNMDYYLKIHIPLFQKRMGAAMKTIRVSRGIGGSTPRAPAAFVAEQFGTLETRYPRRIDPGLGALRKLTYSPRVRCDGPWKPTLLHLRMNFDIIPKMWKGERLSAQFQAPACRSHCLFWVRAYS